MVNRTVVSSALKFGFETEEEKKVDQSSRDFAIHNEPAV